MGRIRSSDETVPERMIASRFPFAPKLTVSPRDAVDSVSSRDVIPEGALFMETRAS